ncbi:MAG: Sigma-70 family polymerase sigma factor [Candidatus Hydrogenedentes bacterium]|nr:Sigma-70 family polymerase sigma factor [Candidatus Hydrogenedentota bacterium]
MATQTGTAAVAKTAAVAACSAAIVSGLIYAAAVLSMNNGARTPEKGEWAIRGSVVNSEGEPMPATRVEARREDGRGETFDTVTDAQGRFAIERLAGGEYVVAAINEKGGLGYMERVPAGLPKTVVALKAGGTIAGRVYDEETGKGIANALVGAVPRDQSYSSALVSLLKQMHVDKTDADGYYTLNVAAPEKYTVAIRDAGAYIFAPPVRQGVALDEGQTRDSVDFPVSCDGSVSGTVTTGTGGAAPNTEVTLINLSCGVLQRTVTDGSGHYAFSGLRMRKGYSILARHNTLGAFALGPVDLTPNQTETALHIRLGAPSGK